MTDDKRITSGMTADATIVTEERHATLALPLRAITYRPDGTAVALVLDPATGKESEEVVETGVRSTDGFVEIRAGLSEGDQVVVPF